MLPPRVACIQVIIVPTGLNKKQSEESKQALFAKCTEVVDVYFFFLVERTYSINCSLLVVGKKINCGWGSCSYRFT